jgi:hypothetical protein
MANGPDQSLSDICNIVMKLCTHIHHRYAERRVEREAFHLIKLYVPICFPLGHIRFPVGRAKFHLSTSITSESTLVSATFARA